MMSSLQEEAEMMGSWDGPVGPLLKCRSGLAEALSDEDGQDERPRHRRTTTRGINAKTPKPKQYKPEQQHIHNKIPVPSILPVHGIY